MSNRHTNSRTGSSPPPPTGASHTPSAVSRSHGGSNVPTQKSHVTPDRPLSSDRPHAPVHNNTLSPTDKSALKSIERKTPRPDSRAVEELDNTLSADRHQAARAAEEIEEGPQDEWDEMLGQEIQGDLIIDTVPPEFIERLRKDQLIAINEEISYPPPNRAIGASSGKRGATNASQTAKPVPKPVAEKPTISLGPETNARSGAGNPIFAHPGVESPMNGLFSQPPTPAPASATPASRASALHLSEDINLSGPVGKGTVSPLMLQSGIMNINLQPQRGIATPQQYTVHSPALLPVPASVPATVGGNRLLPVATMELVQGEMASPAMHGIQLGSGTPKSGRARVHHDPVAVPVRHHPATSTSYARSSAASAAGSVRRPQARAARPSSETSSGTAESGLSTRTQPSQVGGPTLTEEEIRRRNPNQSRKKMVPSEGSAFREGRTGSEASATSPTRSGMIRNNTF